MVGRTNFRAKVVKVVGVVLSVYMVLSPVVVYADGLSEAESNLEAQTEVRVESAASVVQAVENTAVSEAQVTFEQSVANVDVSDIPSMNNLEDTSEVVKNEINNIENEAVKEAANAIVNADMSNVDVALDKVTELVDDTLTDETVASEIEATADTLIAIYDSQAEAALNVLTVISNETEGVTVLSDGSVAVDWTVASEEVASLYNTYQIALAAKADAEATKNQAVAKQDEASKEVDKLNAVVEKNKKENEAISDSKLRNNNIIDKLIADHAQSDKDHFESDYYAEGTVEGSTDIYKFFINKVEGDSAYGCLTYYDSANKIILRKNFMISPDGIDYNYVPKSEWIKNDKNCKEIVFGNGGNYVAAYIEKNKSTYVKTDNTFNGGKVSDVMRANLDRNNDIDARNDALKELEKINGDLEDAKAELQTATDNADAALKAYQKAVAMYKDAAALESEIKKSEVEKAKLEYVKAEVNVWRSQQALDQIKEAIENSKKADTTGTENEVKSVVVSEATSESIETVVNSIAANLGVEPAAIESLVVQTIIETENNDSVATNNSKEASVLGERTNDEGLAEIVKSEEVATAEEAENAESVIKKEVVEDTIDTQYEAHDIVTIDDNRVALANVGADARHSVNWWFSHIIALTFVAWMMFVLVIVKQNKEREEVNR